MPENSVTRRKTQKERSASTVAKVSQATIRLIAETGYVNMTTTMVAERAGVSRGAILHHFSSKSDLVKHATSEMWASVTASSRDIRKRAMVDDTDVDDLIEAVWTRLMTDTFVSVTIDMMTAARGDPELATHVETWMRRMFASYRRTARQVFAASGLSDMESETLILLITSALRGLRIAQRIEADAGAIAAREMLAHMIRSFLSQRKSL